MGDTGYEVVPIGQAHTPYATADEAPHQGFADNAEATLEVFEEYSDAIEGIADVLRLTVVYWADGADRSRHVGSDGTGAFARRSPNRPNPLSICICTVLGVEATRITVSGLDAVDGSPLIDLKPALQTER